MAPTYGYLVFHWNRKQYNENIETTKGAIHTIFMHHNMNNKHYIWCWIFSIPFSIHHLNVGEIIFCPPTKWAHPTDLPSLSKGVHEKYFATSLIENVHDSEFGSIRILYILIFFYFLEFWAGWELPTAIYFWAHRMVYMVCNSKRAVNVCFYFAFN